MGDRPRPSDDIIRVGFKGGLLAVFAMILAAAAASAQTALPGHAVFSPIPLAPDSAITALAWEKKANLWLGTMRGVAHFEGVTWHLAEAARDIGTPWVTALHVDGRGRVWVGTQSGKLFRRDSTGWVSIPLPDGLPSPAWITGLASDVQGRLWVGFFGGGVAVFDGAKWQRYGDRQGLASPWVQTLTVDWRGRIWVGTWGDGLSRFDGRTWHTFTAAEGLPDNRIDALAADVNGTIWIGTADGLAHFDGQSWHVTTTADGLPDGRVRALAVAPDGTVWVGTPRGLARLQNDLVQAVPLTDAVSQPYVSAIVGGWRGAVWVGTLGSGLYREGVEVPTVTAHFPIVLIHGWHDSSNDHLADSQLKFMARWLQADGFPVFYARRITAAQRLDQNALELQRAINHAKQQSGANRVVLIGHSMGGLVARRYVESNLYNGDVAAVIMLGTPNGGVRLWHGKLAHWLRKGNADPSLIELTPEFMAEFNATHRPRADVPYLLVAGDLTDRLDVLRGWPPNDGLITRDSVFAIPGTRIATDDAHGWTDDTILYDVPSYTWPRRLYDRYVRPWLRECIELGSCPLTPPPTPVREHGVRLPPHTPYETHSVAVGSILTETVTIGNANVVRFFLTWDRSDLYLRLVAPDGRQLDGERHGSGKRGFTYLRLTDPEITPFVIYRLVNPAAGRWQMVVENKGAKPAEATVYAVPEDGQALEVTTDRFRYAVGEPVTIRAVWSAAGEPVRSSVLFAEVGGAGSTRRVRLLDDGQHGDGRANDGTYAAQFVPAHAGYQAAFVVARPERGGARVQEVIFAVGE
jgi:hypothetical protein